MLPLSCDQLWEAAVHYSDSPRGQVGPPAARVTATQTRDRHLDGSHLSSQHYAGGPCPMLEGTTPDLSLGPPPASTSMAGHTIINIQSEELLAGWTGEGAAATAATHVSRQLYSHSFHPGASAAAMSAFAAQPPPAATSVPSLQDDPASADPPSRRLLRQDAFRFDRYSSTAAAAPSHTAEFAAADTGSSSSSGGGGMLRNLSFDDLGDGWPSAASAATADELLDMVMGTSRDSNSSSSSAAAGNTGSSSSSRVRSTSSGLSRLITMLRMGSMTRLAESLASLRDLDEIERSDSFSSADSAADHAAVRRRPPRRSQAFLELDTYDDLLALDQYNVKRGVKYAAVQKLPSRLVGRRPAAAAGGGGGGVGSGGGWWKGCTAASPACKHCGTMCAAGYGSPAGCGCAGQGGALSSVEGEARCFICMEEYADMAATTAVAVLPCGHEYCRSCIWEWLQDHPTCPVCRWQFPDQDTQLLH